MQRSFNVVIFYPLLYSCTNISDLKSNLLNVCFSHQTQFWKNICQIYFHFVKIVTIAWQIPKVSNKKKKTRFINLVSFFRVNFAAYELFLNFIYLIVSIFSKLSTKVKDKNIPICDNLVAGLRQLVIPKLFIMIHEYKYKKSVK